MNFAAAVDLEDLSTVLCNLPQLQYNGENVAILAVCERWLASDTVPRRLSDMGRHCGS